MTVGINNDSNVGVVEPDPGLRRHQYAIVDAIDLYRQGNMPVVGGWHIGLVEQLEDLLIEFEFTITKGRFDQREATLIDPFVHDLFDRKVRR